MSDQPQQPIRFRSRTAQRVTTRTADRGTRWVFAVVGLCSLVWLVVGVLPQPSWAATPWTPSDPALKPMGTARGIFPGRVVWVHDPDAASWKPGTGHWWEDAHTDPKVVGRMMSDGLRRLTGKDTDAAAWDAIFKHFNSARGKGNVGYQPGEKIAVKLNLNTCGTHGTPGGDAIFNTPQATHALLRQLIDKAKVPGETITLCEPSRRVPAPLYDLCRPLKVRFVDNSGGDGRVQARPDPKVTVHCGDPKVPNSGRYHLPVCLTEADYVINFALLKGHNLTAVTLCAKNHIGSVWVPDAGRGKGAWTPAGMHPYIRAFGGNWKRKWPARKMGSYTPLVDLMGHKDLGEKTLLFLLDALYVANDQSGVPNQWKSAPFNDHWTSSVFLSQDGVAIDSVGVDFLRNEPTCEGNVRGTLDNYLHEAALAGDPPSGTVYDPEKDGTRLRSLGAHEHWKDAASKKYSRNLAAGEGIELISSEAAGARGKRGASRSGPGE